MGETLLVEIFTEELPPKALKKLSKSFSDSVFAGLDSRGLLAPEAAACSFATPRRLAVSISHVLPRSPDKPARVKVLPVNVALDANGNPTLALTKKLAVLGFPETLIDELERAPDGRTESLFLNYTAPGVELATGLQAALNGAIEALPIPKVMRYQTEGGADVQFVRPAHSLIALYGLDVVPVTLLGLTAGRRTRGHRFQGAQEVVLANADIYETEMREVGGVIASFDGRREEIGRQLMLKAEKLGLKLSDVAVTSEEALEGDHSALWDEVTALVEWPTVYVGQFEAEFLSVPAECLVLTMRANQKYFALYKPNRVLANKFLIVSNMRLHDPTNIVAGNERVVRPRLADARFFFEQDCKTPLAARLPKLASIVYHARLGSQLERVQRLEKLAGAIAQLLAPIKLLWADEAKASRAALLSKADLVTDMVGEFPELQGIMGTYYARHDGEDDEVARAIEEHYRPRFAGDALPETTTGVVVALADKLDALVGIFGAGQPPTGDKDPFGLRRAALGVLRLLMEKRLPLPLDQLLALAETGLAARIATDSAVPVYEFMLERLRNTLREAGFEAEVVDAVVSQRPTRIDLVPPRIEAVRAFRALPEAEALSAANKRTRNILKKADGVAVACDPALLAEAAERSLHASVTRLAPSVDARVAAQDYTGALKELAGIRGDVDRFFDDVLVMAEDPAVRANRLALLAQLERLMNQVADISRLAA